VIRAASPWTNDIHEPFWANARICLPQNAQAVVVLAHHEPSRQQHAVREKIGAYLAAHRLATCAVRLTKADEHVAGRMVLDTETLGDRLRGVVEFLANCDETCDLPVAIFGEGYCGAAAMMVAAGDLDCVKVAGAYCGRPELAYVFLPRVRAATLLVVPGLDRELLEGNERAFSELVCPSQIAVIGNASRRLREEGAVHACRYLIRRWCQNHVLHPRR
jgi:hypothetical protein